MLRDRLFETLQSEEADRRHRLRDGRCAARLRARWRAGWPTHARHRRRGPASRCRAAGAPAPARSGPSPWRPRTAPPPGSTPPRSRPRTTRRSRPGSPTRPRSKVLHDAKGPMLALAARGWLLEGLVSDTALAAYLVRPDQRSYDLADLTLRYLKRELKQETADSGQLSFDSLEGADTGAAETAMLHARAVLDLAEALDSAIEQHGGAQLLADIELPLVAPARADGAHRHRGRHRPPREPGEPLRRGGEEGRRRGVRRHRQGDQPRLAQAAPGGAVRRARTCPRPSGPRPATPPTPTRSSSCTSRPSTRSCSRCCATATCPGCGRPSRACSRPWPRTAASTPRSTS